MLLQDEERARWSDREIARRCAVSHDSVPAPRTYQDRHGNVTQMDTARIGRRTAEPAPSAPVEAEPAKLPPAPEAEPALPLDAPPSNVVRAGDRFSLVPAPGSVELEASRNGSQAALTSGSAWQARRRACAA
jgi:hypothetical protein